MGELPGILCILTIVLAIVVVVGHGLWLFFAKIFSALFADRQTKLTEHPAVSCPRCFSPLTLPGQRCSVCNWPGPMDTRRQPLALATLTAQVNRLGTLGTIDLQTQAKILEAIAAERRRTASVVAAEQMDASIVESRAETAAATTPATTRPPAKQETLESAPLVTGPVETAPLRPPDSPTGLAARAERYAARRSKAISETAQAATGPPLPPRRQALSKLLATFMEEKNIRWGELVGGLLIVCSSIALVISFWSEIAAEPLLKFFLFGGVTAALFAAGLYTQRRWNLSTTSHGLLIIATLLVPLNFLAIAAFTQDSPPTHPAAIGGEVLSIGIFAALSWVAASVYLPQAPALLMIGVMIPSVMQLLTRRFVEVDTPLWGLYAAGALPLMMYLVGMACYLGRLIQCPAPVRRDADRLFIFFGICTYATMLPLALLLHKTGHVGETVHRLAPLVTLLGLPALATGLWFWRQVKSPDLVGERTAGISIGVLGAAAMVAAVCVAWPDPAILLPVAILTAVAFTGLALVAEVPAAHTISGTSLVLAWLIVFSILRGDVGWDLTSSVPLITTIFSASSGTALAPLAAAFALSALAWRRAGRPHDAWWYLIIGVGTATVSLTLVTWFGFGRGGDPHGATWIYAAFAITAAVAATRIDRVWLGWAASGLLLLALIQATVFRWMLFPDRRLFAWAVALLAHPSAVVIFASSVRVLLRSQQTQLVNALSSSALVILMSATSLLAVSIPGSSAAQLTPHLFWWSAIWLALACLVGSSRLFTIFQASVFAAVLAAVTAILEHRTWYERARSPILDPWYWQAQGIAMAMVCLFWIGLRALLRCVKLRSDNAPDLVGRTGAESPGSLGRWRTAAEFLNPPWPAVDRLVQAGLVALLLALAVYAAVPGVCQELAPRPRPARVAAPARVVPDLAQFELTDVPHEHAAGPGSWLMLALTVTTLSAGFGEGRAAARTVGLLLALAAACPLVAFHAEGSTAVASALRWCVAMFFLTLSIPLWLKGYVSQLATRIRLPLRQGEEVLGMPPTEVCRGVLFVIAVAPYLVMATYLSVTALSRAGLDPAVARLLPYLAGGCLIIGLFAVAIRRAAAFSGVLLILGGAPLVVALLFAVASAIRQYPIVGPEPGSFFRRIGWSVSYAVPVLVMATTLVGHALRERSSRIAFAAGLTFNLGATAAFMLLLPRLGRGLDIQAWVNVAQINTIVSASFALGWIVILSWHRTKDAQSSRSSLGGSTSILFQAQQLLSGGLCTFVILPAAIGLVVWPLPKAWVVEAGRWPSWLGAGLTVVVVGMSRLARWRLVDRLTGLILLLATLVGLIAAARDQGDWFAYHTLLAAFATGAWIAAARLVIAVNRTETMADIKSHLNRSRGATLGGPVALGLLTVFLSLRALAGDPEAPWWTIGGLAVTSMLAVVLALASAQRSLLYAASALINVAGCIWWMESGWRLTASPGVGGLIDFVHFNILIAAAPVVPWVIIELRKIRPRFVVGTRHRLIGVQQVVSTIAVATVLLTVAAGLASDTGGDPIVASRLLAWLSMAATFVASSACLWDKVSQASLARLYFVTLSAAGLILDGLDLEGPRFWWMLTMVLAAFSLATSYLWSRRAELWGFAARIGIAADITQPVSSTVGLAWLVPANSAVAVCVTTLAFWMVLTLTNFTERMFAAYAIVAQAVAVGMLARGAVRSSLQYASLSLGVLFAVAFGWAWLPVELDGPLLHRAVIVGVALVAMIVAYSFGLIKVLRRETEWVVAGQRLAPLLVIAAMATILFVLAVEITHYARSGRVPIFWPEIVAVAVALAALCLAALAAAVLPGRDPLGLSERGRQAYVYAAEIVLAFFFVHVRLTMPWLFHGWFIRFWPLVVMGVAFVGVGLAEWFARKRSRVLSQPLETTGALLPILPVLGFWLLPGEVNYSLLLLTAGVLYAALSALRQSFLYGILAALAANGSLWHLLYRAEGLGLTEHPQLWLIPPALCMLVGAYLNRDQLTREQMTAIRYLSAIVIYVASTADIFISGVGEAPWLPLVLAAISIIGTFAGILLRVRAFVYLGTSFLLVALLTIIWHAAVELGYTWLWWVCGIVTGVCIIAIFAVFEKKRDDLLRLVERLKGWEP